jgi:hypothetical protein
VAIELFNPYPFPIDIRNCKLATINRTPAMAGDQTLVVNDPVLNPTLTPILSAATSNMATPAATDPWVIPANGFLVLENYDAQGAGPGTDIQLPAAFRPNSSGMPPLGAIPDPPAGQMVRNHAYVPNLHTVLDQEVVLLRPLYTAMPNTAGANGSQSNIQGALVEALRYAEATPGTVTVAADMAPLDSYDFTGMPNRDTFVNTSLGALRSTGPTLTHSYAWHYSRATEPTTKGWRFVYPGRYDAHQSVNAGGTIRRPRQQGTYEAGWGATPGWDPSGAGPANVDPGDVSAPGTGIARPDPGISLVEAYAAPALYPAPPPNILNATYFPYEYATQLINITGNFPYAGNVGPNSVAATAAGTPNVYPFGGYARNGDLLQVPYMGSYRIKLSDISAPAVPGQNPNNIPIRRNGMDNHLTAANASAVLELNSITMDSVFAEDTDPSNHYNVAGLGVTSRPEQIGRFTPSLEDLEVLAVGTIDDASPPRANPLLPNPSATIGDAERQEGTQWVRHDLVITDGPGKGLVRTVVSSQNGQLTVTPDFEVSVIGSRYILRKGTMWRDTNTAAAGYDPSRTTGNKAWAADLFDFVTVDTPQNDHFPMADPSYGTAAGPVMPPQGVSSRPGVPASVTYGRKIGSGNSDKISASLNLIDEDRHYFKDGVSTNGVSLLQFVTGPAAQTGEVQVVTGYDGAGGNRAIDIANAFTVAPNDGDVFRIFGASEDHTPTQGLVNINTAPWPVLAMLPFAPGDPAANVGLAQEIARYRDGDPSAGMIGHGPFRSIFDLYRVPQFYLYQNQILINNANPGQNQGDWTPDLVQHDFEEHFLLLNRISNMITTRSDSFTVYVLVQGWRGGGTTTPELVVQRRRAFIADRAGLSQTVKDLSTQFLYND